MMYPHVNAKESVDLEESDYSYNVESSKRAPWYHWVLLNRPLKVIIALILTSIVAPLLIYRLLFTSLEVPPSDGFSFGSCPRHIRLPCGYGDVPFERCPTDCCYDHHNHICFHRFPSRFSYILNQTWTEETVLSPRIGRVPFWSQISFPAIRVSVDEVSSTHLSLTFYRSNQIITGRRIEDKKYAYDIGGTVETAKELQIVVNGTKGNIFNTARGPLIASDDIWEIAFKITDEVMYGLGEIPLKENTTKIIYSHKGGLSSIPLIYARSNGSYHGFLIDTTAPTEIYIGSENLLVVRSITSFGLKFHLFVGPNPVDVMKDVKELIGFNKKLDYWMLGAHICSEVPTNDSLSDLQNFISSANSSSMPFESHCGVAPIVFNTDCNETRVTLVNNGITELKNAGKKFVPHVSPYILYPEPEESEEQEDDSNEDGVTEAIESRSSTDDNTPCFEESTYEHYILHDQNYDAIYYGSVDEHRVIYPKYDEVSKEFMERLWVFDEFDALILENNWPLDESKKILNQTQLYLPYFSKNFENAFNHTPQWNATRPVRYLDTHNQYGNEFAAAFEKIQTPVPMFSTSQWMNENVTVNRQEIETSWSSLQRELVQASLGGISGHWFWSSPICGDTENFDNSTQIRLCAKWYMAATYLPMIKIHSKEIRRDPLAFVGTDRAHMITALNTRMRILPYLITVLQEGPLLRPMFYQFPSIESLANLTTQFSVGDDLMIVPNLQPNQSHVHFLLPPGQWYEFWGGLKIEGETGEACTMTTTEAEFLTLIRGGSIILKYEDIKLTIEETRQTSPFSVIIALDCETKNITDEDISFGEQNDEITDTTEEEMTTLPSTTAEPTTTAIPTITTCTAEGKFYITPNMTILFEADANTLTITAVGEEFEAFCNSSESLISKNILHISIFGLHENENNVDNHRQLTTNINLCELETEHKIIYKFVDDDGDDDDDDDDDDDESTTTITPPNEMR